MQIQYLDQETSDYRAGVCNIGPKEIARRRNAGIAAVLFAVGLGVALVAIDAPAMLRAIVLLPLWGGLVSLEQARRKFCVAYAFGGIRGANQSETRQAVIDGADLAADRAAARAMVIYCGVAALAVTTVFVLLPI